MLAGGFPSVYSRRLSGVTAGKNRGPGAHFPGDNPAKGVYNDGDQNKGETAMEVTELHARAREIARTVIDAYGVEPDKYDEAEQPLITAFAYGAVQAFCDDFALADWQGVVLTMEILTGPFGFSDEMAGAAADCLAEWASTGENPLTEQVIQAGADAYYMLDQTEAIRKYLRDAVDYLRRAMA